MAAVVDPTAAMTFGDLIVKVAVKLAVAYYGVAGNEAAQAPTDAHDLAQCKDHINDGIRMFISDAPPNGWRWMRPTAALVLWPSVVVDAAVTATGVYDAGTDLTTVTATAASFYPSMELKTIIFAETAGYTWQINSYVSATQITLSGNKAFVDPRTFSIAADGNYTAPRTFGGQYTGPPTYEASSDAVSRIMWTSDSDIRRLREVGSLQLGTPTLLAVRRAATARRWEVMAFPVPSAVVTVEFPYDLYFDELVDLADLQPAGYAFDQIVLAAAYAAMERDAEDMFAGLMDDYRKVALVNAMKIDARSAPRRLGYVGDGPGQITQHNFRYLRQRPTVTFRPYSPVP